MGKIAILTPKQQGVLSLVGKNDFLRTNFYFTGGTALSAFYLNHRLSNDLDFFSLRKFDTQSIFTIISDWAKKDRFTIQPQYIEPAYIAIITFRNQEKLKADFVYYPFRQLKKGQTLKNGVKIDSKFDIAVNKLLTINQRVEMKDFVDLYYLLKEFSLWDLISGVKKKFNVELDPLILASDFLAVEQFDFLPKMIKPLSLTDLTVFYKEKAKTLGKTKIEP